MVIVGKRGPTTTASIWFSFTITANTILHAVILTILRPGDSLDSRWYPGKNSAPSFLSLRCFPDFTSSPGETTRPESTASCSKRNTAKKSRCCRGQRRRETHPRCQAGGETTILDEARNINFWCDFDAHRGGHRVASDTATFVERAKSRPRQLQPQGPFSCRHRPPRGCVGRWGRSENTNVGPCTHCFSCHPELFSTFQSQVGAECHQFFVSGRRASPGEEDACAGGA